MTILPCLSLSGLALGPVSDQSPLSLKRLMGGCRAPPSAPAEDPAWGADSEDVTDSSAPDGADSSVGGATASVDGASVAAISSGADSADVGSGCAVDSVAGTVWESGGLDSGAEEDDVGTEGPSDLLDTCRIVKSNI